MMPYRMSASKRPSALFSHPEHQRSVPTENPRDGRYTPMREPRPKHSLAERKFLLLWEDVLNGPKLESEFKFHDVRRWRFDFALPSQRIAIEIEGGVWSGGRHSRGAGFTQDCEKYLEAALLGWRVVRLVPAQVTEPVLARILEWVRRQPSPAAEKFHPVG